MFNAILKRLLWPYFRDMYCYTVIGFAEKDGQAGLANSYGVCVVKSKWEALRYAEAAFMEAYPNAQIEIVSAEPCFRVEGDGRPERTSRTVYRDQGEEA